MTTAPKNIYAIGDVQGCYASLLKLLDKINFDQAADELWFAGDLVNRGPDSLNTLRFIHGLGANAKVVLGNHDLFLLKVFYRYATVPSEDFQTILDAEDAELLIAWLLQQPLLYHAHDYTMVHAGIPPQWSLKEAQAYANEVSVALKSQTDLALQNLWGSEPTDWSPDLQGWDRLRYILNAFTRMRYCYADGRLDLSYKGALETYTGTAQAWFKLENRKMCKNNIIFGHWAALQGQTATPHIFAIDTGCVWGERLTALRLHDQKLFSISAV